MLRKITAFLLALVLAAPAFAAPISSYPAASSPLGGTEQLIGTQASQPVNITPAQISAYTTVNGTWTGPYAGQVAQSFNAPYSAACLNIFSYLTAAQQAAVQAGTSTVDFLPIFEAADVAISVNTAGTNKICVPAGKYPFSATWNKKHTSIVEGAGGDGAGATIGSATVLSFPANTWGIIVNRANTLNNTTISPATSPADGSVIRDLTIQSAGGTDITKHGVWFRARATLENVRVQDFPGDQIHIEATAGSGGATEGNANGWMLQRVSTKGGVNGVFITGADVNGGALYSLNAANHKGWCLYDHSFLQNVIIGPQCKSSGTSSRWNYLGTSYRVESAQHPPSATTCSTTTPGTDPNVWDAITFGAGYPTWSNGVACYPGGSYTSQNNSGRTTWIGPYTEGDTPSAYIIPPHSVMGAQGSWTGTGYTDIAGAIFRGNAIVGNNYTDVGTRPVQNFICRLDGSGASHCGLIHNGGTTDFSRTGYLDFGAGFKADGVTPYVAGAIGGGSISTNGASGTLRFQYWDAVGTALTEIVRLGAEPGGATTFGLYPTTDNVAYLGFSTKRWLHGFIVNLRPGAGTATWTSQSGTPEGSLTATGGSFVTDTATGKGYLKTTVGSGNTGYKEIAIAGAYTAAPLTMSTARLLGRTTASSGAAEEISVGSGLTLSGGSLSASSSTLSGTTGSIGGGALGPADCTSGTASVTGATTGMAAIASPVTYPGDGTYWLAYVSSADTVTVKVCAVLGDTPTASAYNVRVLQ